MNILFLELNDTYFRDVAASLFTATKARGWITTTFPELYLDLAEFRNCHIIDEHTLTYADQIRSIAATKSSLSKER